MFLFLISCCGSYPDPNKALDELSYFKTADIEQIEREIEETRKSDIDSENTKAINRSYGRSLLYLAAENGNYEVIKVVLDKLEESDRNPEITDNILGAYSDPDIEPPIILAARLGHNKIVSAFLERSTRIQELLDWPYKGKTAVMYAEDNGHSDVVQTLILAGADTSAFE